VAAPAQDDIGWADFGYHNGSTANTPRVTAWTKQPGTIIMHDFHSGGTHCTPTRASLLTGRACSGQHALAAQKRIQNLGRLCSGNVETESRAVLAGAGTPFRDCVFGTKGADGDDMTEMIDDFVFAPERTWTIGDAVRAASPDYFSQHFG
jgi:hypothetical protein